jgi:hypothetical protein
MPDLVCKHFKMTLAQDYTEPGTNTLETDTFTLDVFDDNNRHFILPVDTIPNNVDLICKLLRRIANAKAQVDWTFSGTYKAPGPGIITG